MLNMQMSTFQQYQQNKNNVIDFVPFSKKKEEAQEVIRNIAKTIFQQFGCHTGFNDSCIKDLHELYEPANFSVILLNFNPTGHIFSFLKSMPTADILTSAITCKFATDDLAQLSRTEILFSFVTRRNSVLTKSTLNFVYNHQFELEKISYETTNQKLKVLSSVSKTKDMLCSIDDESLFLELFLTAHCSNVAELFPEFYLEGVHDFTDYDIESNKTLLRMMLF